MWSLGSTILMTPGLEFHCYAIFSYQLMLILFAQLTILLLMYRCSSVVRSGHPYSFHCGDCVRADWADLSHPACDDSRDPRQRGGTIPAALPLRFHHPDQEVALSPRAGMGTPRVSKMDIVGAKFHWNRFSEPSAAKSCMMRILSSVVTNKLQQEALFTEKANEASPSIVESGKT